MKNNFFDFKIFAVSEPGPWRARCRGENRRRIFVVYQAEEEHAARLEEFLGKVLGAVGLDSEHDISLLRVQPGEAFSWGLLRGVVPAGRVISFGIDPARLGLRCAFPRYQSLDLGGVGYLFADPLDAIYEERQRGGKEKAGALWRALQELFPQRP